MPLAASPWAEACSDRPDHLIQEEAAMQHSKKSIIQRIAIVVLGVALGLRPASTGPPPGESYHTGFQW
jgi:hypothetical protein